MLFLERQVDLICDSHDTSVRPVSELATFKQNFDQLCESLLTRVELINLINDDHIVNAPTLGVHRLLLCAQPSLRLLLLGFSELGLADKSLRNFQRNFLIVDLVATETVDRHTSLLLGDFLEHGQGKASHISVRHSVIHE